MRGGLYAVAGAVAGGLVVWSIYQWWGNSAFLDFRLVELLTPSVNLGISIFIVAAVNQKLSGRNKKRDICLEIIDGLAELSNDAYEAGLAYVEGDRSLKSTQQVINKFRKVSIQVELMHSLKASQWLSQDRELKAAYLELKQAVTDTPFGTKKPYSEGQRTRIHLAYQAICKQAHMVKIDVLSELG